MTRQIAIGVLTCAFVGSPAYAQSATGRGPYVLGGWSLEAKADGPLNGVTFGGGVPLTGTLSVEGSLGWYEQSSTALSYNTPFGHFERQNIGRDVPLAGGVRWSIRCTRRVCPEIVGGVGVNVHLVSSTTHSSCPAPGSPLPCVPVDRVEDTDHAEFLMTGGIDAKVRLTSRFAVVPGFRFSVPVRPAVPAIFPPSASEQTPYYLVNVGLMYRFR